MKKVILFCGVESTGKSTAVEKVYKYLMKKGYNCKIVKEVGRDVCFSSGGVDEMSLLDYELILHKHQSNFLEAYNKNDNSIILLDTDATYTRYYLQKDTNLYNSNEKQSKLLVVLSEKICASNIENYRVNHVFFLNSDSEFVQDGTRTYQATRYEDDKILFELYNKFYNKNCTFDIIKGNKWKERENSILEKIEEYIKRY